MRLLTREELHAGAVTDLGLDAGSLDLTSPEALASSIRRVAAFLCPCAPRTILRSVSRALEGVSEDREAINHALEEVLEAVVAYGDLLELPNTATADGRGRLLCCAPPSFVARESGGALLVGINPDDRSPLPSELAAEVEYAAHVRHLRPGALTDTSLELRQLGLLQLPYDRWAGAPAPTTPDALIARHETLLARAAVATDVPGMSVLDTTRDVAYYRGRWDAPRKRTGLYVARRPQAYGADLWCVARLNDGRAERFVDLPLSERARGCDEAWTLQLAIDASAGKRQRARVRRVGPSGDLVEFFSPVPAWARRRWDAVGEPTPPSKCLFAYRFPAAECEEEIQFMRERLWLDVFTIG